MLRAVSAHGRGQGGPSPPLDFEFICQKKVVFSILRSKKTISPLLAPLEKILGKSPTAPPSGKNPSDAHVAADVIVILIVRW